MPSRTLTIYALTWNRTAAAYHYFFGTRAEAEEYRRDLLREHPSDTVDVLPMEVTLTRQGIAEALDQIITQLCVNDA